MNTRSLFTSNPSKVSGSQSLVSEVTGKAGVFRAAWGQTFWVASVCASKAMVAAKSLPVLGSGTEAVLVVAEGSSAIGGLVQVNSISDATSSTWLDSA